MEQVSCSILSWTSENLSVNVPSNVFFYNEWKPVRPAQESPDFMASKLSPLAQPECIIDSTLSLTKMAIFDFNEAR